MGAFLPRGIFFFLCFFPILALFSTPYYAPNPPPRFTGTTPEESPLIKVQISVFDELNRGVAGQVLQVSFNDMPIALHSPDLRGNRGGLGLQVAPGEYEVVWSVSRDTFSWPRSDTFRKKVVISEDSLWVNIEIHADELRVS